VLTENEVVELKEAGTIGEVCGRFFDADGNESQTRWRDRVISIEIEQLRRIPLVLGVVSGSDRSVAILGAIRGKLLKGLVIDESGALALLATAPNLENVKKPAKKKPKR